jgi:thiol:disulfide interchange protein
MPQVPFLRQFQKRKKIKAKKVKIKILKRTDLCKIKIWGFSDYWMKLFIQSIIAAILLTSVCTADEQVSDDLASVKIILQHQAILPSSSSAIEIKFDMTDNWHFYADDATAPDGMAMRIIAQGKGLSFYEPVFTQPKSYFDKVTNKNLNVHSGTFRAFIPFTSEANSTSTEITVSINGVACSEQLCRKATYTLTKSLEISPSAQMDSPAFTIPSQTQEPLESTNPTTALIAIPLAILAGLLLNVMPCVWPILPIIVMRLVTQAQNGKTKSLVLGIAFAIGIILFFVALAILNIILKLGFGLVFQWGDQFRNPAFVTGMAILMVVLSTYMFGLFSLGIPATVSTGKQSGGFTGSIGMGFLAAVLSTPCSFAILTFVLAWAQTQPIGLATITILLIGVGMAAPYVVLTMIPKMLATIPKPGRWMELFKHATGFILLGIAVKLLEAVPANKIINILYYTVILTVCIWMWGTCVTYDTHQTKKYTIRFIAVLLAILFAFLLLTGPGKSLINWQPYNEEVIAKAQANQQPVLIDFTAEWCLSCKVLEKTVYSNKKIARLIKTKGVLAIKADTTDYGTEATNALKDIYKQPSVPVSILLLPGEREPITLAGNLIGTKLSEYLQNLPDKNQNGTK